PEIRATGGTGSGLLLFSRVTSTGELASINVTCPGSGYTDGAGLPQISIDTRFETVPATLGAPTLIAGVNPNGEYPLPSFAPPGVSAADLNNIYPLLSSDMTHPGPLGVEYLAKRLAQNIYEGVMAL